MSAHCISNLIRTAARHRLTNVGFVTFERVKRILTARLPRVALNERFLQRRWSFIETSIARSYHVVTFAAEVVVLLAAKTHDFVQVIAIMEVMAVLCAILADATEMLDIG